MSNNEKEFEQNQINLISSIKKDSVAEYIFSEGDRIIAIDGKSIKNKIEFTKNIENKKFCKFTILHKDDRKATTSLLPIIYLEGIEFEKKNTSSCMKEKNTVNPLIMIVLCVMIILIILGFILKKNNQQKQISQNEGIVSEVLNEEISAKTLLTETEILSPTTIELLESTLKTNTFSNTDEQMNSVFSEEGLRKRSGANRSEIIFAYDESGNVLNLRDTYLGTIELDDGIILISDSRNQAGESSKTETEVRTRRASNRTKIDYDSVENTLNTITELKDTIINMADISDISEKFIGKIYFDYGSSLTPDNMSLNIEKYLLIQKQSEEIKEYSSIVLGLNDLINKIPIDKRDSAVFILLGYADTTLFNAIPEISERSNKFNTELSLKRAETVKTILKGPDFGIDPNKIVTQGLGYSKNIAAEDDLWKYRRVDIVVSYE